jgi:hypothetical protein
MVCSSGGHSLSKDTRTLLAAWTASIDMFIGEKKSAFLSAEPDSPKPSKVDNRHKALSCMAESKGHLFIPGIGYDPHKQGKHPSNLHLLSHSKDIKSNTQNTNRSIFHNCSKGFHLLYV